MVRTAREERTRLALLADRLSKDGELSQADRNALCGLWREITHHRAGSEIPADERSGFLVSGWACRMRRLSNNRRQIFSFLVPGDMLRPSCRSARERGFETVCLTPVDIVDATSLLAEDASGNPACPNLAKAAVRAEFQAEQRLLDHLVRLGARNAREGMAHLLIELHGRLTLNGLADGAWFPLPIGQRPLGHALGFSVVHVNHTLKQLRADGLLEFGPGWVRIVQSERLNVLARGEADPSDPVGAV